MTTLSLEKVSKHFGSVEVLTEISISFAAASVTALVGDNGAGKSTLLKMIAGVHHPDAGKLLLESDDVSHLPAAELRRRGVEMVYQDLALAPQQDVVANLFMGREKADRVGFLDRSAMRKEAEQRLAELSIKIADLRMPAGKLSGGQQQAVAIARAVMFEPKVLLLDEPTAALAAREVATVLELVEKQRALGRCVILVSHRLNDVFAVADRIVVLKHGKIFSDDPRADLTLSQVVERIVS